MYAKKSGFLRRPVDLKTHIQPSQKHIWPQLIGGHPHVANGHAHAQDLLQLELHLMEVEAR